MQLNATHIKVLTAVLARMSQSLETEVTTSKYDGVSQFICDNISHVLGEQYVRESRTFIMLESSLHSAIRNALGQHVTFGGWFNLELQSYGLQFYSLREQLRKNPLIIQQARCAWLERMIDNKEIA